MHEATITEHLAGCACAKWIGPVRQKEETQGAYTARAYRAYEDHLREWRGEPKRIDQTGLFDTQASLF
jgi:hypothetical protein